MHACVRACVRACVCACVRACVRAYVRACVCVCAMSLKINHMRYNYKIFDPIPRCDYMKDLGVTISNKMNFSLHINTIVKSAFKILGMVKRKSEYFKAINSFVFNSKMF